MEESCTTNYSRLSMEICCNPSTWSQSIGFLFPTAQPFHDFQRPLVFSWSRLLVCVWGGPKFNINALYCTTDYFGLSMEICCNPSAWSLSIGFLFPTTWPFQDYLRPLDCNGQGSWYVCKVAQSSTSMHFTALPTILDYPWKYVAIPQDGPHPLEFYFPRHGSFMIFKGH